MNKSLYKFSKMLNRMMLVALIITFSGAAQAEIVEYTLDNVIQTNDSQFSGKFQWEYTVGDFENGVGTFSELSLPGHGSNISALNISFDIDSSIEFSLIENLHNTGVDVTLFFLESLTPTSSATIDTVRSKWQIGGGFNGSPTEGGFVSGIITPNSDGDGILDYMDNCTERANEDQTDSDADNIGNACDADIAVPNDCIVNVSDLGVLKAAFFSSPGDANWNAASDFDANNIVNVIDLGILKASFFLPPGPSGLASDCQ